MDYVDDQPPLHAGNNSSAGELMDPWSLTELQLFSFTLCLILIIVLGVVGNFLVIYVQLRTSLTNRRGTSTIDLYIFHLSVADFLFLLFCVPFQGTVYIFNDWPYGLALCKVAYFSQSVTMYASIWFLTWMSVDRGIAIGFPLRSVEWRTHELANRICILVWTLSLLLSSPYLLVYTTYELTPESLLCIDVWPTDLDYRSWSALFVFLLTFALPTVIIFCMALLVWSAIRSSVQQTFLRAESKGGGGGCGAHSDLTNKTQPHHRRRRRRVVWLVFALSLVQLACWCPHSVTSVWVTFHPRSIEWVLDHSYTFFVMDIFNHMGTYLHSCLNPIVYSLASEQFRVRLVHAFRLRRPLRGVGAGGGRGGSPNGSGTVSCYGTQQTQQQHQAAIAQGLTVAAVQTQSMLLPGPKYSKVGAAVL